MADLAKGQVWVWENNDDNYEVTFNILDIIGEFVKVMCSSITYNDPTKQRAVRGGQAIFVGKEYHIMDYEFDQDDIEMVVGTQAEFKAVVSSDGMTCGRCGNLYPYAEGPNQDDGSFKCWGCREGF